MEKERADRSVSFYVTDGYSVRLRPAPATQRGYSPIVVSAGISVLALLVVVGWQISASVRERTAATSYVASSSSPGASDRDIFAGTELASGTATTIGSGILDTIVSTYLSLHDRGLYTPEVGAKSAEELAKTSSVPVSFRTYTAADIPADADSSYARMLAYRHDLQVSLAPLLRNTQPEYEIFAYYVSTKDKKYLEKLQRIAQNYREAASSTALVVPPKEALGQHLDMLNSMNEFAAVLDAQIANVDDPLASAVLLRSYNNSEASVLSSFAALAKYYREKQS
ncbi:hypothetical protein A3D71_03335 [Candidatus Kaiserbacteria bacterium RIFCSPHIGHO2_02_FULL_55_20]|uniref:Uncharacterized protein n=1 Tax=Candidatus Kaiserbacteria bacterium RIFCSPHIGHO2_02_FULL_55_20 TaxID=1798497 RepID=A0A1F6DXA8_9BACT|nr:MAG: hypothetical protein A2680_02250 [Candidatus Kaiserbacteria bacterium RIFCSPHIGHO2_01_FULL_55_37]OGG66064.1 MAG: hypothetical protein A3D71_03335 [Candidatus Kaiserbacteria bacterium RIFCSPHIGHO2_02_FULL_55_20]